MTTYPYAASAKVQASMDAIGAAFIGSQEVTILKQILIGVANGGITPPFDPIVITAPDGAYAGAPLIITGGAYAIYADGEYVLAVNDELPAVQVYQFVINGMPVGDWVTSTATIPDSVVEGDLIQVQDLAGNLSNTLVAIANPDPTVLAISSVSVSMLTGTTGLVNHPSGGVCAAVDNVSGSGYIALPDSIDPTRPFRAAVLMEVNDARSCQVHLCHAAQQFWSGESMTATTAVGVNTNSGGSQVLSQVGNVGGAGMASGTQVWMSVIGDGERVTRTVIAPDAAPTLNIAAFQGPLHRVNGLSTALPPLITAQFSGNDVYGSASQPQNYLSRIRIVTSSTQSRVIAVYVSQDGIGGGVGAPGAMQLAVLQDESPWVLLPGSYGGVDTDAVLIHHPNANPGNFTNQPFAKATELGLVDVGFIVFGITGADNINDFSGATSSCWSAPAGLVYRKALVDRLRVLLRMRDLNHMGYSMGANNALNYERDHPGARAVVTISGAVDLADSFTNRGFSSTIRNAYGTWYRCIQAGTGQAPASSPAYWSPISANKAAPAASYYSIPYVWRNMYAAGTAYAVNDVVCVASGDAVGAFAYRDPVQQASSLLGLPIAMWHGDADALIPLAQMTAFAAAAAGGQVTTHTVAGGTHLGASMYDPSAIIAFFQTHQI